MPDIKKTHLAKKKRTKKQNKTRNRTTAVKRRLAHAHSPACMWGRCGTWLWAWLVKTGKTAGFLGYCAPARTRHPERKSKSEGYCGSYRAGRERRNSQIPTSTQALLPTSTHSNDFCIMRVCIRLSSRQPPSWLARVIKWWAIPIKNLACWIARLLNCYKRFSNLYLRW